LVVEVSLSIEKGKYVWDLQKGSLEIFEHLVDLLVVSKLGKVVVLEVILLDKEIEVELDEFVSVGQVVALSASGFEARLHFGHDLEVHSEFVL
jgi:hypothetical protein